MKRKAITMGVREYARHRNVNQKTVQKWIEEGKIKAAVHETDNGHRKTINVSVADSLLEGKPISESGIDHNAGGSPEEITLTKARTAKVAMEAKTAQLKYEALSKSLVKTDRVIEVAKEMGRLTRESMMTIPDRLAPILAGVTEIEEIHKILFEEINTSLRNLVLENFDFFKGSPDEIE